MEAGPAWAGQGQASHSLWRKYIRDKMDLIHPSENVRMTKNLCARTSGMIKLGSDIEY